MKKSLRTLLTLLGILLTLFACSKDGTTEAGVDETGVKVDSIVALTKTVTISLSDKISLVARVYPENATNKTLTWSSANSAVATVDAQGAVAGLTVGKTIITAKNSAATKSCQFTVEVLDPTAPIIFFSASSLDFGDYEVDKSSEFGKQFVLKGKNLNDKVVLKAPIDFKIKIKEGDSYATELTVFPTNSEILQTIYVLFTPSEEKSYVDKIVCSGGGATEQSFIVKGKGFVSKDATAIRVVTSDNYHESSVAVDGQGNRFISGSYQGSVKFGHTTLTARGSSEMFVAKLDQNNNYLWVKSVGGPDSSSASANNITLDNQGNCYVVGDFRGTAIFGNTTLISEQLQENGASFIAKLDNNGNWQWANQVIGQDYMSVRDIALDNQGNCHITGSFEGYASFGSMTKNSEGQVNIFVAKLDNNGNWLWITTSGGSDLFNWVGDSAYSLDVDASGNCYVVGSFGGDISFGSTKLTSEGDNRKMFVAKLDNNGNWLWAKSASVGQYNSISIATSIKLDFQGNCYITGLFDNEISFGSKLLSSKGSCDVFIAKLDKNGNWLLAKSVGGSEWDVGIALTIDSQGDCFITGAFRDAVSFDATILTAKDNSDIFISKLDNSGNWLWAKSAGGNGYDAGSSIALDNQGNGFVTGYFEGAATFDNKTLTSKGKNDIFLWKFKQ